ncbi:MAG: carbohydrate-binding protein [Bacteroidota bacterium]
MRQLRLLIFCALLCTPFFLTAQGFLHAQGKEIVNGNGDPVILKGMGLGGWMLQEGYMLQTAGFANAQYQIREKIESLIGTADTDAFYDAWLANHVRKVDIDSLAAWGFNSVRLPMHYNLFTLPIEDEPIQGQNTWLTKGFELTDSLISWCAQNQMYVILDLHAAPGGQGMDQGISDYDPTKPSLWESKENRDKTVALWKRIAERYANESWIGGYDLINETNWNMTGNSPLRDLYYEITDSIRTVDTNHILFIEGNWFANDFTGLTPPWDNNMVYSPHKYWSINDQASIQWVLDIRNNYDVPLYFGETGENSNTWFRDAIQLFDTHNLGWAWWPMKKVESIAGPLSVTKSQGYQDLLDFWDGNGSAPSASVARNTLMQLTDDLKLENCRYQKEVIDAMFRQINNEETQPFADLMIPGVIQATDFDMGPAGQAYHDTDIANYQVSTGNYTAWNQGWSYRNDGIDIEKTEDSQNTNGFNVGWMSRGEWMQYTVDVAADAVYDIHIRVAANGSDGKLHFAVDGADITPSRTVPSSGGWQNWQTVSIPNVVLNSSDQKLRFHVDAEGFNLNAFEFIQKGPTTDLQTEFISAFTLDDHTIQLNLNKRLSGPLPTSPANFSFTTNGNPEPIATTSLDPDNPRIIRFSFNTVFTSSDNIRISYNGSQIDATDGTPLQSFSQEIVQNRVAIIHELPGRVEAENFFFQSGIQLENTSDAGGGQNIGFLDVGDYADYFVNVSQAGTWSVDYRTAALSEVGAVELQLIDANGNATALHTASFPSTGGWQSWATTNFSADLPAGLQHIRVVITQPLFNINWLDFTFLTSIDPERAINPFRVFPNPGQDRYQLIAELEQPQQVEWELIDVLGKKIQQNLIQPQAQISDSIDLSALPAGQYILLIRLKNGEAFSQKIIHQP